MSGYATQTRVSVASSKFEIENTLNRFGIHDIGCFSQDDIAAITFKYAGRPYLLRVTLPDRNSPKFHYTPSRRSKRTADQAYAAWEQACRVKWRELALLIKAKLVAISNDAASFDDEFLAYAMLPNRQTMGQWAADQLSELESRGALPEMLPGIQAALPNSGARNAK